MNTQTSAPPAGEISRLTDHLFRHEAGKMVSVLTGIFGFERLQWAEDIVQEALVRALQTWPYYGIPKNPAAWLMQTAKNLAIDLIRREKRFGDKQPEIIASLEGSPTAEDAPMFDDEIKDERLRLIFSCCHPLLPQEAQIALALKTLCGFSPAEIAQAFLSSEAAIAKRLTRARQRIQEQGIPFEIPSGAELAARLEGVLQVLYLLFNEGYKASSGQNVVREELCAEAIRLATLLAGRPAGDRPGTHALLALMLLNGARLPARVDGEGNILRLEEQDRALWDQAMIQRGILHLGHSAAGSEPGEYHLQAAISACHCMAPDYASTDWTRILALYDRLAQIDASPVVALNRAVALAKVHGPAKGIEAVEAILSNGQLESYHLLHAVLGEFEAQQEHFGSAAAHLRTALRHAVLTPERTLLTRRLHDYEQRNHSGQKINPDVPKGAARSS